MAKVDNLLIIKIKDSMAIKTRVAGLMAGCFFIYVRISTISLFF